ncbi:MAG: arsenosugar biosynthesis radical SAM (seleno)protein ArsS [Bacteroidia bacterium]
MKSLKGNGNALASAGIQVALLAEENENLPRFEEKLETYGLYPLKPTQLEILQINVGKMCNQICTHCHVDAGPDRKEIMRRETMSECLEAIRSTPSIHTVDLTGGAPEMNPDFEWFVSEIHKLGRKTIVRSNLTILVSNKKYDSYPEFFANNNVTVIASLPCYTAENTDKQRGDGVFAKSIEALKRLNKIGYGIKGTGLELHLVYNPGGPSLPPSQEKLELDYKKMLLDNFEISFNNLYTITNLPISRFLDYLLSSDKYEEYMEKLVNAFNPAAAAGVMCRNTVSVSWDGNLFDCDFNQMLDLSISDGVPKHIREFSGEKLQNRSIVLNRHCFGCTAGAGSSCQGSIL